MRLTSYPFIDQTNHVFFERSIELSVGIWKRGTEGCVDCLRQQAGVVPQEGLSVLWVLGVGQQFDIVVGDTIEELHLVLLAWLVLLLEDPPKGVLNFKGA